MGYRIFEENNNDEPAVGEEVGNVQNQGVQGDVEGEEEKEEQEGCEESGNDEVDQNGEAIGSNFSRDLVWCQEGEKKGEKNGLSPVVRLQRLDEGSINIWTNMDMEEEQKGGEESGRKEMIGLGDGDGGSILTRGLKFSSADEFFSFMGEDGSEGDAALQQSAMEINYDNAEEGAGEEQRKTEEVGRSLEKKAELCSGDRGSSFSRCVKRSSGYGNELLNPVIRLKKIKLDSNCKPSQERKSGTSGKFQARQW